MKFIFVTIIVILSIILFIIIKVQSFKYSYLRDVNTGFERVSSRESELLTEEDITHLPSPVQKYLRYTRVLNREKIISARFYFEGTLQEIGKPEFRIRAEQTSFFDIPTRLFYIKGNLKGIPVMAFHKYRNANATFEVKPLSLFHIINQRGGVLNTAETVTFLNDMCFFAPSTLIDKKISWEQIDSLNVKANLTINGIRVSAILTFNEEGQLINFRSNDRYYLTPDGKMEKAGWTTPVRDYMDYGGFRLASYGEAIWNLPDGDFTYAKFHLKEARYNFTK